MATTAHRPAPKAARRPRQFVYVGSRWRDVLPGIKVGRKSNLPEYVRGASKGTIFVSQDRGSTDDLLNAKLRLRCTRAGELVTIEPPRPESVPSLEGVFERVHGAAVAHSWLPMPDLSAALNSPEARDRFVGAAADPVGRTVTLIRGDLDPLVVPFAHFEAAGDGTEPDFSRISLDDRGRTVAFGGYEASADGILYEFDPEYRRKLNRARREADRTFGASLRRLRIQRRLRREDFGPDVAAKTIARIERNEFKPRPSTLAALARRLGVAPAEIETF